MAVGNRTIYLTMATMRDYVNDTSTEVMSMTTAAMGSGNDTFVWVKQPVYMVVVLSFAYGLVLVVALAGNLCVVGVVYRDKHFHTPTYVFIVNLAIADLAVAVFCLPVTLLTNVYNGKSCCLHAAYCTCCSLQ